ncbi:uncharacterized protein [Rutidosis leptorrhynchoides]|uniref:uncharacterized protein n=1 Tax=Rutidosis leptorrhynchoides TaxID=125765 RepID=UPI003A9A63E1
MVMFERLTPCELDKKQGWHAVPESGAPCHMVTENSRSEVARRVTCGTPCHIRVYLENGSRWVGWVEDRMGLGQNGSDPADEKENSALLLSRQTYPPRDSWNFSPPFGYAGTKSPLTTNQQTSSGWVLPGRSEQQVTPRRRFYSWAAVSRSRGRFAPCPRIWVICSHTMLLQSDLAGERSQFATENKTASERTFVRFFSTKHGSLRITVGRWLPKETPIRSAPRLGGIYLIPITRRGSL